MTLTALPIRDGEQPSNARAGLEVIGVDGGAAITQAQIDCRSVLSFEPSDSQRSNMWPHGPATNLCAEEFRR